jgi:hypothetical protein
MQFQLSHLLFLGRSTCFERYFRSSSGASKVYLQLLILHTVCRCRQVLWESCKCISNSPIYYSLAALHVLSDIFSHHQEHLYCIYSFWFYTRYVAAGRYYGRVGTVVLTLPWHQPAVTYVCQTRSCKYSLDASDDERKYRSKHIQQPRNNKLSHTVVSCWSFS